MRGIRATTTLPALTAAATATLATARNEQQCVQADNVKLSGITTTTTTTLPTATDTATVTATATAATAGNEQQCLQADSVKLSRIRTLLGRLALVGLVMQHPMSTIEFAYTDSHIAQNAIDPAVS